MSGEPPDILLLGDQVAVVGQQLVVEIHGVDPDGDRLAYQVDADIELDGTATMTQMPNGVGLFLWTPLASQVGQHAFDFTAWDGSHRTTVSNVIDVRTGTGAPVFRQPLSTGRALNVATEPCLTVDILVEDLDTAQVTITEEAPKIPGGQFSQLDGTTAQWRWCPTGTQIAESDRYTLLLSASDDDNPKTLKAYVIVLGGEVGPGLIINEVDYDNVGSDTTEYLELYNASASATSLAGLAIVLINGATSTPYSTIDLSGAGKVGAGGYLVIAGPSVTVPTTALKLDPLWTQDEIQNGAPDGIALVDTVTHSVIDALSYEGSITGVTLPDFPAPVTLVEGAALSPSVVDSNAVNITLCRKPNAQDSNDAASDWTTCGLRTVGTANLP